MTCKVPKKPPERLSIVCFLWEKNIESITIHRQLLKILQVLFTKFEQNVQKQDSDDIHFKS